MPTQHLDELFNRLDYVSTLTFSGGEPTLVPGVIEEALTAAR
jgi:pyruvate-formate lyase-activating enzyme